MNEKQEKMKLAIEKVKYVMNMSYARMAELEYTRSGKKISRQGMHRKVTDMIKEERVEDFKDLLKSLGLTWQQIEKLLGE